MNESKIRKIENYPDIFTVIDFANYMGIGKNTAYAEVKSGAIKTFKLGKKIIIPKKCVEEYVASKCYA